MPEQPDRSMCGYASGGDCEGLKGQTEGFDPAPRQLRCLRCTGTSNAPAVLIPPSLSPKHKRLPTLWADSLLCDGGEGGIRTLERVSPLLP